VRTHGDAVELVVANDGARIGPDRVAELTRPFHRGGPERTGASGSGLGLAIVAAVTEAHGGRLDLRAREEGGLRVLVALPRAGAEARAEARAEAGATGAEAGAEGGTP
jgi:signal transduction histidine kinase